MRGTLKVIFFICIISSAGCISEKSGPPLTPPQAQVQKSIETPDIEEEVFAETSIKSEPEDDVVSNIGYAVFLSEKYKLCLECHGDVKPFHTVEMIYLIDKKKGLNPRLCIVCHGQKVHDIHWEKLEADSIECETCHDLGGEFVKPVAMEGQLLVCEVCHSKGNYIKIHIEGNILEEAQIAAEWIKKGKNHECDTCHVGDFGVLHVNPINSWKKDISNLMKESRGKKFTPLDIKYN